MSAQLKRVGRKYKDQAEATTKEFEEYKAKQESVEQTEKQTEKQFQVSIISLFGLLIKTDLVY
jgi:hypothetical protein